MSNKEPIKDGATLIYTERKDGIHPGHDIRTDRFEQAVEAMDYITRDKQAKREERAKSLAEKAKEGMAKETKTDKTVVNSDGAEPIQGTK